MPPKTSTASALAVSATVTPTPALIEAVGPVDGIVKRLSTIHSGAEREEAYQFVVNTVLPLRAQIEEFFGPNVARWKDGYQAAKDQLATFAAPLKDAESRLRAAINEFDAREKERARLIAEARAKAIAEEAERVRESRVLEEVARLSAEGRTTEATELASTIDEPAADSLPAVRPERYVPPSGKAPRKIYTFEVVDAGLIPREFMIPNASAIGALVRSVGPAAENTIPGIRVIEKSSVSFDRK